MKDTVLTQVFDQLKKHIGEEKFSQMFDEVYWLDKERKQIRSAYTEGIVDGMHSETGHDRFYENSLDYYNKTYGGNK